MGNLFNLDNPFFTGLTKFVDLILVSILWLICCIPIITIVPATSALYYTVVKVIRRERGYISREFFHAFKTNFKSGTIAGLILTALVVILVLDRRFTNLIEGNLAVILFTIFNAMLLIVFLVTLYLCPVLSRFSMSVKSLYKTAFFMAMRHLPTTILLAVVTLVFTFAVYIIPFLIIIVPGLTQLVISFLMERVLKKYMPEKSEEAESNGIDEWYLE
ncbi:MAG: YesL family protein [Anaerocolumna sp.]